MRPTSSSAPSARTAWEPSRPTPTAPRGERRGRADGAKVIQQWAVLGPYDFVNIVEAPDEKVIARVSVELGARGPLRRVTAIPVDEFLSLLK